MAISFGRRGTGGGAGGVQAVFLEAHQSGSASPSNATWTGLDTHTPAWQIGDRATGKVAVNFGVTTTTGWNSGTSADVDYQVRVMARTSANSTGPWTTEEPLQIVAGGDIAYRASQHTSNDTTTRKNPTAYIPFALSDLPNNANFADGRYIQFGLSIAIDSSPSPNTITVEDAYISFTSFGSGYGVPPGLSIGTDQIADGAVTRPKIADDAVDGSKIASGSVGDAQIAAGGLNSASIASSAVTGAKIAGGAVTGGKIASAAITGAKLSDGAVTGAKIADGAIEPEHMDGLSNDPARANQFVRVDSTGDGFYTTGLSDLIADGSITTPKLADDAVTSAKLGAGAVNTEALADDAVTNDKIASGAVEGDSITDGAITDAKLATQTITGDKIAATTIAPAKLKGISNPAGYTNKHIAINSTGTGFVAVEGGSGGGGITSVEPSDLDGLTGGATDASKFVKTDSTGDEFEAGGIALGDLGLQSGAAEARKVVAVNNAGSGLQSLESLAPRDLGLDEGIDEAGKVVAYNTQGTAFEAVSPASGGVAPTLSNITGVLNTAKGGTGISATDLADLRAKLGIAGAGTDLLDYTNHADTQKNYTITRIDSSTDGLPTGVADGVAIRVGNDQLVIDLSTGHQWKRNITSTNNGTWSSPVDASPALPEITAIAGLQSLAEGGRSYIDTTTLLPSFTDGSKPSRVIVGRNGAYLVAIDRNNFWWAPRPTAPTWTAVDWRWEQSRGAIPQGLVYSGGEADEEHIPAGEDAVLDGKTGIDGDDYIQAMVDHTLSGSTSTYTAYFINDDASHTIQTSTNTRGYTTGEWSRVQADAEGIDNEIVATSRAGAPVVVSSVAGIDEVRYPSYTIILSGTPANGNVLYTAGTRTLRIKPRTGDEYLSLTLKKGLDIELRKDATNFARGIVSEVTPVNNSDDVILTLRGGDSSAGGTLAQGDGVTIVTRGLTINNLTSLSPYSLGVPQGATEANKLIALDSTGMVFTTRENAESVISDGAITADKLATDSVTSVKIKNGAVTGAKIASGVVDGSKIANGAIDHDKLATGAIQPENMSGLSNSATDMGKAVVLNSTGDGFTTATINTDTGAESFDDLTGVNPTTKGGTGINATDLTDLRSKLGVGAASSVNNADVLVYTADARTQKNNTSHRIDSSTSNAPTGVGDGIITRVGNDQYVLDLETGHTWRRALTTINNGVWTAPAAPSPALTEFTTAAQFVSLADGGRGYTDTDAWLPTFTDNSKPARVIVGRHGNYLIAIDRNNMWWAPRITDNDALYISWQWEGISRIPDGLVYTGGENDEEHIPAGEDAVLSGKTGIDGDNFITVLVNHTATSATLSTYTAWFINDDNTHTIQSSTNTRGYTEGSWARTRLDVDGISTDIFVPDTDADGNERPAFVGVVPAISDLHFGGYTYKTGLTGISEGDVAYIPSTRVVWIYHKTEDVHLPNLFAIDYEVSIHKDDTNYIRGVFNAVRTFPLGGGVTLSGAEFREDDLDVTGTIASGDDVSMRGHKAVLTKTDVIDPINIGINHGSGVANQAVLLNADGDGFTTGTPASAPADGSITNAKLAADAVTPLKVAGIDTGADEANKHVAMNDAGTAFTLVTAPSGGGGTPGNNSITHAMLQNNIIENDNMADDSVGAAELIDDSVGNAAMANNAIDTDQLAAGAVTGAKIANNAVDTAQIAADAITGSQIADDAVDTEHLADDAVETAAIATGAVDTDRLATDAVTGAKIADDSIGSEHLIDDSVTAAAIADGAVGSAALAADAVTPLKIDGVATGINEAGKALVLNSAGTGWTTRLIGGDGPDGTDAVLHLGKGTSEISQSVSSATNVDDSVVTDAWHIANRTNGKAVFFFHGDTNFTLNSDQRVKGQLYARWADNAGMTENASAWTAANVFNGSNEVWDNQIDTRLTNLEQTYSFSIPFELSTLPTGAADGKYLQFRMRYNLSKEGASNPTYRFRADRFYGFEIIGGGDGDTTIGNNTITQAMMTDDSIGAEELIDGSVGNAAIAEGAVDTAELAADAVTGAKIEDDAVASEHIATGAVTADAIAADAVTGAKIADGAVDTDQIAADAITGAKIADGAVDSEHIANDAITPALVDGVATGSTEAGKALVLNDAGTGWTTSLITSSGGSSGGLTRIYSDLKSDIDDIIPTGINEFNYIVLSTSDYNSLSTGDRVVVFDNNPVGATMIPGISSSGVMSSTITKSSGNSVLLGNGFGGSEVSYSNPTSTRAQNLRLVRNIPIASSNHQPVITAATSAWQLSNKSTSYYSVEIGLRRINGTPPVATITLQIGYSSTEDGSYTWIDVPSTPDKRAGFNEIPSNYNGFSFYSGVHKFSEIPSISDDDYLMFRIKIDNLPNDEAFVYDTSLAITILPSLGVQTGSGGGGGGTPSIGDGSITRAKIAADAIDNSKLADDAVDTENIADDAITAALIDNGAVGTDALAADAVNNAKLADDAVRTENIADDAITNALIANDAVNTDQIADGAVDTDRLAADAVTGAKLADDSVGSEHIIDDAVVAAAIADGAVGEAALASDAVTNAKIANNAVQTDQINDGAVNNSKLAADAVTPLKIAGIDTGADEANKYVVMDSAGTAFTLSASGGSSSTALGDIDSVYNTISGYTFKGVNESTLSDGETTYVLNTNNGTGQIAIEFLAGDSAAETSLNTSASNGQIVVLYRSPTQYVALRKTGQQSSGNALAITGDIIDNGTTIAASSNVSFLYGSTIPPQGVARIDADGTLEPGYVTAQSLGIDPKNANNGDVIIVAGDAGHGLTSISPCSVGIAKAILLLRNNTGGSGDGVTIDGVSLARRTWTPTQNLQTGAWTMANKASDWLRVSAAGLYYFGAITGQPVCADLELWVRWRRGSETWADWANSTGNISSKTRVAGTSGGASPVAMGGDRLQITKLFAGGTGSNNEHVDMAVPSGVKFVKLSQLPSDIADGDEVQFTVGFAKQNPSPNYRVRNFFLSIEVIGGDHIHANY